MSSRKYIKSKYCKMISLNEEIDPNRFIGERMLWLEVYNTCLHDIEYYCQRYDYFMKFVKNKYKKKQRRYSYEQLLLMNIPNFISALEFIFKDEYPYLEQAYEDYDYKIEGIKKKALELLETEPRLYSLIKDKIN